MKRLAMVFLVLLLLCPVVAFAEGIDLSEMTREELHTLIDQARTELLKYEIYAGDTDVVLLDADGIKVTLQGYEFSVDKLIINAIIENNGDQELGVSMNDTYINGWDKYISFQQSLATGKKAKYECTIFHMDEVDILSEEDLDTIEFTLKIFDGDFKTISVTEPMTLVFNPLAIQ